MLNVLLFFITYISGFIGGLLLHPAYIFVLYEAVYFFNPQRRWWGPLVPDLSYSYFVVIVMIGLLAVKYKQFKSNRLLDIPQFKWMYFVLLLYVVAYFYAVMPQYHMEYMTNYIKLIVIVSVAYKLIDSVSKLNWIIYGYIFGSWYIGWVAFQTGRNSSGRVEKIGTVDSPDANGIAAAIAPSLVFCLYYFWTHQKKLAKAIFVFAGMFIANGIVLINSRGSFLAIAASMMIFMYHMYFSSFQRKYQKATAIMITLFGLIGAGTLMDDAFIERMKTITNTEVSAEKENAATRTIFWKAAWDMAKDHPFGAGYHGFNHYAEFYIPHGYDTGGSLKRTVHSTWFETLSEVGYMGLIGFILMLFTAQRSLAKCKKELRRRQEVDEYFKVIAIEAACVAFIVAMTFLNRMRAETLYWLLLYTGCAYNLYVLKYKEPKGIKSPASAKSSAQVST
ncbi:O-antigen ligase family protein [Hahella ganghwensis]|uniref:O-antigen ligase family protein n=1 Tax=Hahella ganghwensis TaxID=286420 RepID=UPI000372FDFF|nr:O-antigen ligase family protein [Hahella ganghwensis]